jgi:hypothetical protein
MHTPHIIGSSGWRDDIYPERFWRVTTLRRTRPPSTSLSLARGKQARCLTTTTIKHNPRGMVSTEDTATTRRLYLPACLRPILGRMRYSSRGRRFASWRQFLRAALWRCHATHCARNKPGCHCEARCLRRSNPQLAGRRLLRCARNDTVGPCFLVAADFLELLKIFDISVWIVRSPCRSSKYLLQEGDYV